METSEVMAELAALEDPKARAVNERHGDDHGVNLGKLRAVAKRLRTQQDLATDLWRTGDTAARLLATLICRPKAFERAELDAMLREARTPRCTTGSSTTSSRRARTSRSYVRRGSPTRIRWSRAPGGR
ncbi:hypothetical protein GCM10029964_107860 [Kibdelosporangium lantanae]